jgi:hypothetical protein
MSQGLTRRPARCASQRPGRFAGRRATLRAVAYGAAALAAGALLPSAVAGRAAAAAVEPFRIGTGGQGGTYYPIGTILAGELTRHLGEGCISDCPQRLLLAVAQASNGSVSNVRDLAAGQLEAGLVQADIAHWAFTGTGIFAGRAPIADLRAVGRMYPESLHVVASAASGIRSFADLRGKRVALDEQGSGTLVAARLVLQAHGLGEADLQPVYAKAGHAVERLRQGKLDAFFTVAGAPVASVLALAEEVPIVLVPLSREGQRRVVESVPFFVPAELPAGLYAGTEAALSLEVGALLLTRAVMPAQTIETVTGVLWHPDTLAAFAAGHPMGALIRPGMALDGLPLPLHPGAARYYRAAGELE